jgi:hypothetical protein
MASSSSTLLPPTPKPTAEQLHPHDIPPAYDRELRSNRRGYMELHPGSALTERSASEAIGISDDAFEEWRCLES